MQGKNTVLITITGKAKSLIQLIFPIGNRNYQGTKPVAIALSVTNMCVLAMVVGVVCFGVFNQIGLLRGTNAINPMTNPNNGANIIVASGRDGSSRLGSDSESGSSSSSKDEADNWSEWVEKLPRNITEDSHEIEEAMHYSFREKDIQSSTASEMSGYTFSHTSNEWGPYGNWSDWTETPIAPSDSVNVETKTQYSYRDGQQQSSVGAWSGWSTTPQEASTTRNDETKIQYRCRLRYIELRVSDKAYIRDLGYSEWSEWTDEKKYMSFIAFISPGDVVYKDAANEHETRTLYRYQDIINTTTYGNWSGWSDQYVEASALREVQTRTLYRSATRVQTQYYHFYKWSEWSDYSIQKVEANENREVRESVRYRYRSLD